MSPFKAFLIDSEGGKITAGFTEFTADALDPGEVTVRVAYSGINYKDALAATGAGRIIRRFPCIGGVELAGTVLASTDPRYQPGEAVIGTGYDIGVAHHGGYAEVARLPADWLVPLPAGLTLFEAMALGTAGFTAALAIVRMEQHGLAPDQGPVIVTGATGGVGSLAIDMLAGRGYRVVALTGKTHEADYLRELGAAEVLARGELDLTNIRPLERARFAGAVDNLGGDVLAWLLSSMQPAGNVAAIGLAASMNLNTTVAPFILRGVNLLGIDSVQIREPLRSELWQRMAGDLRPRHLAVMTRALPFADLPGAFADFIAGRAHGRVVVAIGGD